MNLVHFYHIYADGNWYRPFDEHLDALRRSGLLDALGGTFNVGIVGSSESYEKAVEYISNVGASVSIVAYEPDGFEQVTLDAVSDFSQNVDEAYVLYAHTKGAAYPRHLSDVWRRTMTHCNVMYWQSCVAALDDGCHMVGCHWMKNDVNEWFFGGNFFWAKASALRLLPKCERWSRYLSESWVNKLRYVLPDLMVKDVFADYPTAIVSKDTTIPYLEKIWLASRDS